MFRGKIYYGIIISLISIFYRLDEFIVLRTRSILVLGQTSGYINTEAKAFIIIIIIIIIIIYLKVCENESVYINRSLCLKSNSAVSITNKQFLVAYNILIQNVVIVDIINFQPFHSLDSPDNVYSTAQVSLIYSKPFSVIQSMYIEMY